MNKMLGLVVLALISLLLMVFVPTSIGITVAISLLILFNILLSILVFNNKMYVYASILAFLGLVTCSLLAYNIILLS